MEKQFCYHPADETNFDRSDFCSKNTLKMIEEF